VRASSMAGQTSASYFFPSLRSGMLRFVMALNSPTLRLPPLRKQSMAQLIAKAKRTGVPPEDYARQLVEDGLALQQEAESMTIAQIMAPVRRKSGAISEDEIVKLVAQVRKDYRKAGRTRKR
jgi:hypothetical protein